MKTNRSDTSLAYTLGFLVSIAIIASLVHLLMARPAQSMRPKLTPLALEGRDIYNKLDCGRCHQNVPDNRALTLSGGLFAAEFPFSKDQVKPDVVRSLLTGNNSRTQNDTVQNGTAQIEPSDAEIRHAPLYPSLSVKNLDGTAIMAKMMAMDSNKKPYSEKAMIQASLKIAGHSELEALTAYLNETARD